MSGHHTLVIIKKAAVNRSAIAYFEHLLTQKL